MKEDVGTDHIEKNYKEMVNLIKKKFHEDPLFIECQLEEKTQNRLFPDFLGELSTSIEYRVPDVAAFVERSPSNVRYYLTTIPSYIGVGRTGSNYRLSYDSVYRVYLVSLYVRDLGKGMSDIKVKTGEEMQVIPNPTIGKKVLDPDVDALDKKIKRLNKDSATNMLMTIEFFKKFTILEEKRSEIQALENVKQKSFLHELKLDNLMKLKDKEEAALNESRLIAEELLTQKKRIELENERKKNAGFFSRWKSVVVEDEEISKPSEDSINATDIVQERLVRLETINKQIQELPLTKTVHYDEKIEKLKAEVLKIKKELREAIQYIVDVNQDMLDIIGDIDLSDKIGDRNHEQKEIK